MKRFFVYWVVSLSAIAAAFFYPAYSFESPAAESSLLTQVRQLTYEGRRSGEGYFSPDGTKLIFQSEREAGNPFYQIYMLDFLTGAIHRVSPGYGKTTCAYFHPETKRVLFSSSHLDEEATQKQKDEIAFRQSGKERRYSWDFEEHMDIFSSGYDGARLKRLTQALGYDAEASYSPDGRRIVFCSTRQAFPLTNLLPKERDRYEVNPSDFGEIYIMNADGSNIRRLTHRPGYDGGPFFSPDGQRIVWRAFDPNGAVAEIYTMQVDGSDKKPLTEMNAMSWAPYYHPSQEYVIFTSNKFGFSNFELFLVDAQGEKEPVRVTEREGFDGLPVFSPDGTKLAWTSNQTASDNSQLFLAEWNHDKALTLLEHAALRKPKKPDEKEGAVYQSTKGQSQALVDESLSAEITQANLKRYVFTLASDDMEGRMTGSAGAKKAANYLVKGLQAIHVPSLISNDYFQPFEYSAGAETVEEENWIEITFGDTTKRFASEHFRPLSFSSSNTVEGELVFAGYGLSMPGDDENAYDSYQGLDVSGKIVLVLRYVPENVGVERKQELNRYAGLRYKAMIAREHGAKGLLVVTGPNSPNAGELVPMQFDTSLAGSGIAAGSLSGEAAKVLFAQSRKVFQAIQNRLDSEEIRVVEDFKFTDVTLKMSTSLKRIKKEGRNVLAVIHPSPQSHPKRYVMLGAHYDHLGYGANGSLADKKEAGKIHNGADDNASGAALVMELAGKFKALKDNNPQQFRQGVILAFWSGEELGLIGSSHFADNPPVDLDSITAYLNFDMVGRLRENRLTLQGVGSSSIWRKLIEQKNILAGFQLNLVDDPYLPTDTTSFYPNEIPVLSFFTGSHEDYHRPSDDADKIHYEGLTRIADFAHQILRELVRADNPPDFQKVERQQNHQGARAAMRVYLGTIPNYTKEVEGVLLDGVGAGGPADKAGLQGGDVVIELAGQKIKNIYDYTYAIDALTVDEPAEIVILRNGEELKKTIVPAARK